MHDNSKSAYFMCLRLLGAKYAPDVGLMQHLHHQARRQELKRSEWPVILWTANARKMPTAVLGSVGPVYRQPIATISDINFRFKITRGSKATKEALSAYQSASLSASWFQRSGMHF